MFKIFTKKSYRFSRYVGSQREEIFDVSRGIIVPVPDWVEKDPMFKMALNAGNISIISTAGNANLDAVDMLMNEAKTLGIKNPGTLTLDALQMAIAKAKGERDDPDGAKKDDASGAKGPKGPTKSELVAEATALGIDRPSRLTAAQLQVVISQAKAATAEQASLDPDGDSAEGGDGG